MTRTMRVEWMTVSRAARVTGEDERTIERWIADRAVESRLVAVGQREVRLLRRDTLPDGAGRDTLPRQEEDGRSTPAADVSPNLAPGPESRPDAPEGGAR